MHDKYPDDSLASIRRIDQVYHGQYIDLPKQPGVYAFWWMAPKAELMAANRHIVLKGPNGRLVDVEYRDWWHAEIPYPCLYIGKSMNIRKRFSQHIKSRSPDRLHKAHQQNLKAKPHTSTCQLRQGIEHIFPTAQAPLDIIFKSVGFSYHTDFPENAIAERFFEEDRLIGTWRPWFNIDSER